MRRGYTGKAHGVCCREHVLSERDLSRCVAGAIPSEDGAELPYGLKADSTLAHVSEVPSGLACACTCPGCGAALVARKGRVLAHHFAHHVDRVCTGAWETTLHLLAKEVIAASRSILLPEALAVLGQVSKRVAGSVTFCCDEAELIAELGTMARNPHSTPLADLMGLPLGDRRDHVFGSVESGGVRP